MLQKVSVSGRDTLGCGNSELSCGRLVDIATEVASVHARKLPYVEQIQRKVATGQPIWLLAEIYRAGNTQLGLAKLSSLQATLKMVEARGIASEQPMT